MYEYTVRSGVIFKCLRAFPKIAKEADVIRLVNSQLVRVIPVFDSVDGIQLNPGCQMNQVTKELVGTTRKIDIDYIKVNPIPNPLDLKEILVTKAVVSDLTTLDNKIALPLIVYYECSMRDYEKELEKTREFTESRCAVYVCSVCYVMKTLSLPQKRKL